MKKHELKRGCTVRFNEYIEEYDTGFEEGMLALIGDIKTRPDQTAFVMDFCKFRAINTPMEQRLYRGKGEVWSRQKWHEHVSYPENGVEFVYLDYDYAYSDDKMPLPFDVVAQPGEELSLNTQMDVIADVAFGLGLEGAGIWMYQTYPWPRPAENDMNSCAGAEVAWANNVDSNDIPEPQVSSQELERLKTEADLQS